MKILQLILLVFLLFFKDSSFGFASYAQDDYKSFSSRSDFLSEHFSLRSNVMRDEDNNVKDYGSYSRKAQSLSLPTFLTQLFPRLSMFLENLLNNENNSDGSGLNGSLDDNFDNDVQGSVDDTIDNDLDPETITSANPSSTPSIKTTEIPSSQPTMISASQSSNIPTLQPTDIPTNNPTKMPTKNPTNAPTVDVSERWKKTFDETGKIVKLSSTGDTLIIIKREGIVYIYERNIEDKSWTQVNVSEIISNVWGDLSIVADDLTCEISANGDNFIIGSKSNSEVAIFSFDPAESMWNQVGTTITDFSIGQFGSLVDLSVDGSRVLAGGSNGLAVYELENSSWVKTGSILQAIESFTFYSVNMNDAGTNVIANVKDNDGYYYDNTRTVKRYSLPTFEEFPDYPIDPFLTVIEVSTTKDNDMMALTIFDQNDYYAYDDYYYPKNDLYIYKFDHDINEFNLIFVMDGYFALSDSLSGDGNNLITVDPYRSFETGEFIFRSHIFQTDDFVETGSTAPDEGDENSIGLSISEDGSIYALVFGDIINVWEKV